MTYATSIPCDSLLGRFRMPVYFRSDAGTALLTVREACSQLRISKWTLYGLLRSGQLDSVRIGRRRLIAPAALEDLVRRLSNREAD